MLRQVFVIQKDDIVYQRMYANALSINELDDLLFKIKRDAKKESAVRVDAFDYYKYRVCYALKQFLESQFARLQKAIADDEFISTKLKDDKDAIIITLCCAYLAKTNPELYLIFDNILNDLTPFKGFDVNTINDIESYFLRIIKKY